ncbi:IMPACT family protein [Saccharospirillum sp. MSK14-1]|uniref:IMPACT family protein n=1 Tax=Saccharospirillum sp. MSK14-1 TaxID=1897632 RepID=UPI000D3D28FB|nr:YigZ family protein [Saccharospirillum sp. MSK14-1]PTY35916.1 IMPACT family protein [Saccharospirillum sp. MSK14-1]
MKQTLAAPVAAELVVKKSRFLAWVEPVADKQQAQHRLAQLRQTYPDARHLCFAFSAGGDSGMSDDGEPSGTAGKPMFNVLSHKRLDNVLAVVVRYFGGIKLGAGGLVRAYGGAVSQALEQANYITLEAQHGLTLSVPFALESEVRRLLDQSGLTAEQVDYGTEVTMTVQLPHSQLERFTEAFNALAPANPAVILTPAD